MLWQHELAHERGMAARQGEEKGRTEGIELINLLNGNLVSDGRMDDLKRSFQDKEFQQHLLEEYHLV